MKIAPREKQVVELLALGFTYEQIAKELNISDRTVQSHVYRLKLKLDATTLANLVAKYIDLHNTINVNINLI